MNSIVNSYLEEVEKRLDEATSGPWKAVPCRYEGWQAYSLVHGYQRSVRNRDYIRSFDAEFIAHSRTDNYILYKSLTDCLELLQKGKTGERDIEELVGRITRCIQEAEQL